MPSPLQQARQTDPYLRWEPHAQEYRQVVVDGDHVGWTHAGRTPGEVWATVLGEDVVRVVAVLEALDVVDRYDGITVHDAVHSRLPEWFRMPEFGHWSFWILEATDLPRNHRATALSMDDPRIAPLLGHSTSAEFFPGDPRIVRWFGVVEDGELLSVAGQLHGVDASAWIVSVCTHPDARGRGLAADPCTAVIEAAEADGAPAVWLEMYAQNESARRLYRRLGFREAGRYCSGFRPRVTA